MTSGEVSRLDIVDKILIDGIMTTNEQLRVTLATERARGDRLADRAVMLESRLAEIARLLKPYGNEVFSNLKFARAAAAGGEAAAERSLSSRADAVWTVDDLPQLLDEPLSPSDIREPSEEAMRKTYAAVDAAGGERPSVSLRPLEAIIEERARHHGYVFARDESGDGYWLAGGDPEAACDFGEMVDEIIWRESQVEREAEEGGS